MVAMADDAGGAAVSDFSAADFCRRLAESGLVSGIAGGGGVALA